MTPLRIDRAAWAHGIGRQAFVFEHTLDENTLFRPDAVAALAGRLPAESVEHHVGDVGAVTLDGVAPTLAYDPEHIARHIEELGCWMMLRNVEREQEYRELLASCFEELEELLAGAEGGMVRPEGYLFYSAAGSVTPTHLDSEHNFLCHVRGPKEVAIGGYSDEHTAQLKAERKYRGGQRNLDVLPHEPTVYTLQPGQGVYIPPLTPHWVRTGDDLCVSIAITFRTVEGMRNELVHAFNGFLRSLGLDPRPPGGNPARDTAKAMLVSTWRRRPRRLHPPEAH